MGNLEKDKAAKGAPASRLLLRPAKKLEHGDQLIFHHALRCLCNKCGRILTWVGSEAYAQVTADCCSTRYVLQPRTITVRVEDIEENSLLPIMKGSSFVDPNMSLSEYVCGEQGPESVTVNVDGLSEP